MRRGTKESGRKFQEVPKIRSKTKKYKFKVD